MKLRKDTKVEEFRYKILVKKPNDTEWLLYKFYSRLGYAHCAITDKFSGNNAEPEQYNKYQFKIVNIKTNRVVFEGGKNEWTDYRRRVVRPQDR